MYYENATLKIFVHITSRLVFFLKFKLLFAPALSKLQCIYYSWGNYANITYMSCSEFLSACELIIFALLSFQ